MNTIHWSPEARESLREIAHWVRERAGARAAARLVRRIRTRTQALKTMPRLGRVVPEYEVESVREIIVAPYRVLYRISADGIEVIMVLHGRRQLPES